MLAFLSRRLLPAAGDARGPGHATGTRWEAPPPSSNTRPRRRVPAGAEIVLRDHTGFVWRSREGSRIEAFSDAVFAFSLALLVVSTEVPGSVAELMTRMRSLPAFGLSFTVLVYIWYNHHIFFRRYGLQTPGIVALNSVLLFVVLVYTYPLKALPALVIAAVTGFGSDQVLVIRTMGEAKALMTIYSAGFGAVFLLLALMTGHALRRRGDLGLDAAEVLATRAALCAHLLQVGIAVLSMILLAVGPAIAPAGWCYALMAPVLMTNARIWRRRVAAAVAASSS
ncbi:MAG: DUF1211 domain-containing protein [bacterium]|nr:DUF1211 domain-containing protein [bacterium]